MVEHTLDNGYKSDLKTPFKHAIGKGLDNVFGVDLAPLIEYVHQHATSMPGKFSDNVGTVVSEIYEKAKVWLQNPQIEGKLAVASNGSQSGTN